jgi:hypothetical protein
MPEMGTQTEKARPVYTDGWNSYWHFVIGLLAVKFPLIAIPLFLMYQLLDMEELNVCVDILECLVGMMTGIILRVFYLI